LFACFISKKGLYSSVEIFEKKGISKENSKPQPGIKPGHAREESKTEVDSCSFTVKQLQYHHLYTSDRKDRSATG
jgi:hypothetical protein